MFQMTIIIIVSVFLLDMTISTLNYRHRNTEVPKNVDDIYDEEEYKKWLDYTFEIFRFSTVQKTANTILIIVLLTFAFFPKIAIFSNLFTNNPILQVLLFFGVYISIDYIFSLPFQIYKTFSIEERYNFNKTTIRIFIGDQFKSILMTVLLGGTILYVLLYLYQRFQNQTIIYAWFFITILYLLINILYTNIFLPLFNKLTPLSSGELYDKASQLVKENGFSLNKISIMDASKRSSRLNAFFSGFGRFKHIILYDTLIEKCTNDEIISVLAHEIGHAKHKDLARNFIISMMQTAFLLILLGYFLNSSNFAHEFGFSNVHIGFSLILFAILMEALGIILSIPLTAISRRAEYKADEFAANCGYATSMISALKVLAHENFSNLTPHPLLVVMSYSHPPISMRIEALTKLNK